MVDIVTRAGKGSPLTNNEVDANFTNLAEVSGITGEPMGHEDRTTSTISFNASTRTFTIAPVSGSFTVWCKGKKVVVSSAQTVTIPNTSGMHSIYYDANGTLLSKIGYFSFSTEAPTAYVYWNATTGAAPYFGDERHGVVLDWQTHEYLHRTRGAAIANGFLASGYTLNNSATDAATQIAIESGTFFDEDMKIDIVSTATPTAGTYQQNLLFPAKIPVLHLQGTSWVMDAPTNFPFRQGTSRPQYNSFSGGVWSTADVGNNQHATTWILATNNLTYPVIAIIGQSATDNLGEAEAFSFADLSLTGFPSVEFRPLYKLIYKASNGYENSVNAQLVSIVDLRSISAVGSVANPATDHGNLSGLSDDDHPQYLSVDTVRGTLTAAVKASFLPSQTDNAGKFLTTDATSTSWAALTSGNITTALGFTPYNATNPAGYITGITSSNVTTALGFTPYNATNPSGFVTAAGARGAISVTGAGSYDSATGVINIVGGVTSFNTRTGAITLSSADVTTALGFTPYNNTNPNNFLTGITSAQVTTALGYTPYNSSNPSGYITGITSGMVTTALGFTPYNNSNPSGYITSSALSGYLTSASAASTYLPLAGGTITGSTWSNTTGGNLVISNSNTVGSSVTLRPTASSSYSAGWSLYAGASGAAIGDGSVGLWNHTAQAARFYVTQDGVGYLAGNLILHGGNYNSYAPTLTGTGASGTWAINITGSAATATTATNQSGGMVNATTGTFSSTVAINGGNGLRAFVDGGASITSHIYFANAANNRAYNWQLDESSNAALWGYGGSAWAKLLSVTSGGALNTVGAITQNGSQVLHAGNYSSYALPLSGGTLTGSRPIQFDTGGGSVIIKGNSGGWGMGLYFKGTDDVIKGSFGALGSGSSFSYLWAGIDYANTWMTFTSGQINSSVALTQGNNQVLHAGNFGSYALPLTGGTISGLVRINSQLRVGQNTNGTAYIDAYDGYAWFGRDSNSTGIRIDASGNVNVTGALTQGGNQVLHAGNVGTYAHTISTNPSNAGPGTLAIGNQGSYSYVQSHAGQPLNLNPVGNAVNITGNTAIHAGNYSSYALPLSGGGLTGNLGVLRKRLTFSSVSSDANHSIYNNYDNIDGEGSFDGMKMNVYDGLRVRVGNASGATPTQILSIGSGGTTLNNNLNVIGGRVTASSGGANTYGIFSGYDNNNHFIGVRCVVSGTTSSPTFTGNHHTTFVEYAEANDSTGWFFKSSQSGSYVEIARITRSQMNWNGNTVLHAGNYTSYSPSLGGSGASGTWGINVTGSAGSANILGTTRNINGTGFNGSANIDTTEWFHSDRDFPSGTLITTNINYAVTDGDAFVLEIRGNSYGNIIPLDLQYQGYIYANTIINHGGLSNGLMIQGLVAINNGGNLCFWFPSQGYWNGYNVKVYAAFATRAVNRVTSITGTGKPTTAKEVALTAQIRQSLHSSNFGNYALPLSGGTVTGNTTIGRDLYISGQAGGSYGNRLIVGNTTTSYTLEDTNQRPVIQIHGPYPVLSLNHTITGNTAHGPTIQFTCNGVGNQFVIGTSGNGTQLDMGYASNSNWNPHNGIAGYEGTTFFRALTNGYIGLGAPGDWGPFGGGDPSYHLHFKGTSGQNTHAAAFQNNGSSNGSGFLFQNDAGNHSWGVVSEFRIGGTAGTDRPSILFSHGYNSNTWSVGFGYADDQFRINQNHGHRNGSWGTERFRIDTGGTAHFNGNVALHAGNFGSYAINRGGDNVSGIIYFQSNRNTTSDSCPLQAYSSNGSGATMSFHRGGYYAVNFGLDSDNVMRIGGWSASANRWQLDMSGNMTVAGNVTAYSDERLKKDWGVLPADYIERLAKIKSGTYTRIDSEERQAGVSAQDFQKLLPETVSTDNDGMLSVNYGGAALASAVELAKRVVEQEKRIAHLESLINKLIGD